MVAVSKTSKFGEALTKIRRQALVEFARSHAGINLGELLSLDESAAEITIDELMGMPVKTSPIEGGANTKSPDSRKRYDASILAVLKEGGKWAAGDIRDRVGGTPLQIRTAASRLIAAGEVSYLGQARGTRYWVE